MANATNDPMFASKEQAESYRKPTPLSRANFRRLVRVDYKRARTFTIVAPSFGIGSLDPIVEDMASEYALRAHPSCYTTGASMDKPKDKRKRSSAIKNCPEYAQLQVRMRKIRAEFNRWCAYATKHANELKRGLKRSRKSMHTCHLAEDRDGIQEALNNIYCCETAYDVLEEECKALKEAEVERKSKEAARAEDLALKKVQLAADKEVESGQMRCEEWPEGQTFPAIPYEYCYVHGYGRCGCKWQRRYQ